MRLPIHASDSDSSAPVQLASGRVQRGWLRYWTQPFARLGLVCFIVLLMLVVGAPYITAYDPVRPDYSAIADPPSEAHPFGTDRIGRDVLSRTLAGGGVSLAIGLISALVALALGAPLGLLAGYSGGPVDQVIMRISDMVQSIPKYILILTLVTLLKLDTVSFTLIIGVLNWVPTCRLVRGQVLGLREESYVEAVRACGASAAWLMWYHLFPAVFPLLIVTGVFGIIGGITAEVSLGFLGLGVQPPQPSWGNMLNEALDYSVLVTLPWLWIPPALAISFTILSINWIGEGLRAVFNPKSEAL